MRVLHLYAGNLFGGIETLLVTLARYRELCPEMEPEFGLCFRGRLWDELEASDAVVHDLGAVRLSRPWTVWSARRRLGSLLKNTPYDFVATHACWPHAIFGPVVRKSPVPLVHFVHDAIVEVSRIDKRAAQIQPDLVIANSHYSADHCRKIFPECKIAVVYLPVANRCVNDPSLMSGQVREELKTDSKSVVILQVSRLERWKGAWKLIQALEQLRDDPRWTAWIAGGVQRDSEKAYFDELESAAIGYGIADRVKFLGNRNDVDRLMASADIFCQANTAPEPFGITFLEAMYAGLPVVTSDLGGPAEFVNEACGSKVPAGDDDALALTLMQLIDNTTKRQQMGLQGKLCAHQLCDPASQLRQYCEVMAEVTLAEKTHKTADDLKNAQH